MAKVILNIDSYIGPCGYSKQWISRVLDGHKDDEIIVNISSLGGDVNHALSIHDQFVKHGNVTAVLSGFVASSGTIIAMGAKKIIMSENAFFLIHKVLGWVDVFGYMNEDDIEELITKLTKEKNTNAKITLQLAKLYTNRTNNPTQKILNLMKEQVWLNAEEALQWGFITEIEKVSGSMVNLLDDFQRVAMITSNGLPLPVKRNQIDSSAISADPVSPTNNLTMNKQLTYVNELLNVEQLESDAEGIYLQIDQVETINSKLQTNSTELNKLLSEKETLNTSIASITAERDASLANVQALNTTVQTLTNERDTATNNAADAQKLVDHANADTQALLDALNSIDPTIAQATTNEQKINALREYVASKPGVKPVGVLTEKDPVIGAANNEVDWSAIDALPHNQSID